MVQVRWVRCCLRERIVRGLWLVGSAQRNVLIVEEEFGRVECSVSSS